MGNQEWNQRVGQGMARRFLQVMCVFLVMLAALPVQAGLSVHNSQASQRPGSEFRGGARYVDILYDATGTTAPLTVSVLISNDDGATWDVRPTTGMLSGDIGAGIMPGVGNHIVWDAGTDRPGVYWEKTKARVIATELFDTVAVTASPTTGTWGLSGPAGFEGNGQTYTGSRVFTDAPAGDYLLECNALSGYVAPTSETLTLIAGDTVVFNPTWTAEGGGAQEITIMLPGNVPMVLMRIPKGTFMMGSPDSEQDRHSWEGPQHEVTLTNDFYMGKYEVTKAQWTAVMGTTPWEGNLFILDHPDSPAQYVSWNDINGTDGFLDKLNDHLGSTGQPYRLPSEAEWEYSCRANTTTRFYWGDDPNCTEINDYAWWFGNTYDANERYPHKVGEKNNNAFGLYDMSGNVNEWCQDFSGSYGTGAQTDPTGPLSGSSMMLHGGGWGSDDSSCRSASREGIGPDGRGDYYGFRIVRTQD